jgi:hypothetical protein
VITSSDLIRKVAERVCEQLGPSGELAICDAPQEDSSFERIANRLGLYEMASGLKRRFGVRVNVLDLRSRRTVLFGNAVLRRVRLRGDPRGTVCYNLGTSSLLYGHRGEGRYYGADYDTSTVNKHHQGTTHQYLISATPVESDIFINMPKLKTHKKTGVTLNLKNLVGINADKNWLPHFILGTPRETGGDQYPERTPNTHVESRAIRLAQRIAQSAPIPGAALFAALRFIGRSYFGDTNVTIRSGNWHGNDTTWRMALDLNRCLLYGLPDGSLAKSRQRRYYSVIDGIIGMEGNGPLAGKPKRSDVVIGGEDPVTVDAVAARVMGFDWRKLPIIREAFRLSDYPITSTPVEKIEVCSDVSTWNGRFLEIEEREFLKFEPHFGWLGHIEYQPCQELAHASMS